MDFLEKVKTLFRSTKLDVAARFELEQQAITGTMSTFRVAREIRTGRKVGIKFLNAEKTAAFESRFKALGKPSEGEIGMQIKHPRVAETYEFGVTTTGQPYIIMQYIEGPGLASLIQRRDPRLEGKRVDLIRQMAEAVQAVHQAGFIHRDICPRNFLCDPEIEHVTLIDFGLTLPDTPPFRQPGNRTGTPLYMAPEIVRRRPTDKRVDIFALGVTAYRLLTFEHPWPGEDITGRAALAHDTKAPIDIFKFRPNLNKKLAAAVYQCMAPKPDDRPDSAARLLWMIRNVQSETEDG